MWSLTETSRAHTEKNDWGKEPRRRTKKLVWELRRTNWPDKPGKTLEKQTQVDKIKRIPQKKDWKEELIKDYQGEGSAR